MIRKALVPTVVAVLLLTPAAGQAQNVFVFAGGGIGFATGSYSDLAKTGWLGTAGLGFPVGNGRWAVGAEGYYGRNSHDETVPAMNRGATNLLGGSAWVGYRAGPPERAAVYFIGSAGVMNDNFDPAPNTADLASETKFLASGGAGVDIPLGGNWSLWLEGRYMWSDRVTLVPFMAGLSYAFGGGGM